MLELFDGLDISQIVKVYSGKQGYVCEYDGVYIQTQRSFKSTITRLKKKVQLGEKIYVMKGISEYIISWEGDDRAIRIYTKENLTDYLNTF
jgi:hypothetical protein